GLGAEYQAGNLGLPLGALGDDLVATDSGLDGAGRFEVGAGKEVAGLAAMDAADERLGVVQAANEVHLLANGVERLEHLAERHGLAFALGPPFLAVEAVAGEEGGEPHRRLGGSLLVVAPHRN